MPTRNDRSSGMSVVEALRVVADLCCGQQIVVTNQGSARIWPKLRRRPLDVHYNPSTMSGAIPLCSAWRWLSDIAKCWRFPAMVHY